jgi:hypothetical protein
LDFGEAKRLFRWRLKHARRGAKQHLIFAGVMCLLVAHNLK